MQEIIEEIKTAIENKTYRVALALALTLPDICCQVENKLKADENANRSMYINWVNKHMDNQAFQFPLHGFDVQTFNGEMCYSLRCKILHNGNSSVKNLRLGVRVDEFVLTYPNENNYFHGYKYVELSDGKKVTYIGIDYLCEMLCDAAENFYQDCSNKSDFEQHSF